MIEEITKAEQAHILTSMRAGIQTIVKAGNQGYLTQIRSLDTDKVLVQESHETQEDSVNMALRTAMRMYGTGTVPETALSVSEKRVKELETSVAELTEKLNDLEGSVTMRLNEIDRIINNLRSLPAATQIVGDNQPTDSDNDKVSTPPVSVAAISSTESPSMTKLRLGRPPKVRPPADTNSTVATPETVS